MNEEQVIGRLIRAVARAGSQRAFAGEHGMSAEYVRLVITGRRPIGDRILAALRLEKVTVTTYRRIRR